MADIHPDALGIPADKAPQNSPARKLVDDPPPAKDAGDAYDPTGANSVPSRGVKSQ